MPKQFSGHDIVAVLTQRYGFTVISQRGSHVKLRLTNKKQIRTVIVPLHREIKRGTFAAILRQAGLTVQDF